jgi:hypothetical protein
MSEVEKLIKELKLDTRITPAQFIHITTFWGVHGYPTKKNISDSCILNIWRNHKNKQLLLFYIQLQKILSECECKI